MSCVTEVERARKLIEETCKGYKIAHVDTHEDKIVYTGGITHEDYVGPETNCQIQFLIHAARTRPKHLWEEPSQDVRERARCESFRKDMLQCINIWSNVPGSGWTCPEKVLSP